MTLLFNNLIKLFKSRILSPVQRVRYLPLLVKRDGGFSCFYCKKPLRLEKFVLEHLNNNRCDNRIENIVLSCQSCNLKKITDPQMKLVANDKLRINEASNSMRERNFEVSNPGPTSTEIEINLTNYDITEQYISERVNTDGLIHYNDALNSVAYLCKQKTGHGSQQATRNYISLLTCAEGPLMVIRDSNKKKIIIKREVAK